RDSRALSGRKIGTAARGGSLLVDDHTWEPPDRDEYQRWLARNTPSAEAYAAMREAVAAFSEQPLVSILVATDGSDSQQLRRTTESLQAQVYQQWELCTAPTHDQALRAARGSLVAFVNQGD